MATCWNTPCGYCLGTALCVLPPYRAQGTALASGGAIARPRTPGARADLLDLLQRLDGRPTSKAALAKILGRTPGCVGGLLSRLRAEGLIATVSKPNRTGGGFVVALSVTAAPHLQS